MKSMDIKCEIVVMAAGKGTRMRSPLPKVLHKISGWPILRHVFTAIEGLSAERIYPILGHGLEAVQSEIESWRADGMQVPVTVCEQKEQKGTGHALQVALEAVSKNGAKLPVVILSGDGPLITSDVLQSLLLKHQESQAQFTVGGMELENPFGYGRLVQENGLVKKCVEEKDASDIEREIQLVNGGIYVAENSLLEELLPKLSPSSVTGELYLTELIELGAKADKKIITEVVAPKYLHGVNDFEQLSRAQRILWGRKVKDCMREGVRIEDSNHTYIEMMVEIGQGTRIEPNVYIYGNSKIGRNVTIQSGSRLENVEIADNVMIKAHSVLQNSTVREGAVVGPMAHLRPGADLGPGSKVGNYVEVKKSVIGKGSKVSHLSYVGDAEIGEDVNIGCGFVACNYDGVKKSKTTIEDRAFIGSSVQAIAPVTIHADSYVSTGSVINRDVPSGDLSIARARQVNKEGYARKFLPKKNAFKEE